VTRRFSERSEAYVRYRPAYPQEIVQTLEREASIRPESTRVVDVGCGTGIAFRLFLAQGYAVTGVEPSEAMREAAIAHLAGLKFEIVDGVAERIPLPNNCCELVLVGQAFHWFEVDAARSEMKRVLSESGVVALLWNVRRIDTTAFLVEYEQLLRTHLSEYGQRPAAHDSEVHRLFRGGSFQRRVFENHQRVDFDGLLGRSMSSSYFPRPTETGFESLSAALAATFQRHALNGLVTLEHDTVMYFGRLSA
jgi:SAM-dependent methyltransferase